MSDQDGTLPLDPVDPPPEPGPTVLNDDPPPPEAPPSPAPVAAPVDSEFAPAPDAEPALPPDHVKVELLHDVSLWIHGVTVAFVAGWNVVHKDIVETIRQTHQKSALRE